MDHIHEGGSSYQYVYPGKMPDDETIEAMRDGLEEMIPLKLQELMDRQDELWEYYQGMNSVVHGLSKQKKLDSFGQYFWTYYNEIQFIEYAVINKWIKHYLGVAKKLAPDASWHRLRDFETDKLTDAEIGKAKEYPIEDMFEGRLRVNGDRLIGNCPFHEEKTGSFVIFRQDNHYYCFGCHKHGDAIDFYMHKNEVTHLKDAVRALL